MNDSVINRFSLRRMMMVLGYYRAPLRKQLIIFAICELAMFIISALPIHPNLMFFQSGLSGYVITFLWWLGPLAFSAEGSRELAAMLPARASEKFCAMMLHCLIIVPALLFLLWTLPQLIWDYVPPLWKILNPVETQFTMDFMKYAVVFSIAQLFVPFVTVLWVVLAARKSAVLRGILAAFGAQMALMISGIVVGVFAVFILVRQNLGMLEQMKDTATPSEVLEVMNAGSGGIVYIGMTAIWTLLTLYLAFALWRSYRLVAYKQY